MVNRLFGFLLSTIALTACFVGEDLPPDQDVWGYDLPSNTGLIDSSLLNLDVAIKVGSFDPIRAAIIIKDENIVFENYYDDGDRGTLRNLGRTSPIVTVLALGIAIEEGLLFDLDQHIFELVPIQYQSLLTGRKREITLRHLLTHRSGLAWNESVFNRGLNDPQNDINQLRIAEDAIVYLLSQPLEADPGLRFNFNTGTALLIARIIQSLSGEPFDEYVNARIFQPLEIGDFLWERDGVDNINAATGLWLGTLDLAKIGYVFLRGGRWRQDQLVFEEWITEAGSTQMEISNTFNYGYYWQTFSDNLQFIAVPPPNDVFYFSQHIYVQPSRNLLIIFGTDNVLLNTVSSPLLAYREITRALAF